MVQHDKMFVGHCDCDPCARAKAEQAEAILKGINRTRRIDRVVAHFNERFRDVGMTTEAAANAAHDVWCEMAKEL